MRKIHIVKNSSLILSIILSTSISAGAQVITSTNIQPTHTSTISPHAIPETILDLPAELSDDELDLVRGGILPIAIVGAAAEGAAASVAFYILNKYQEHTPVTAEGIAQAAAMGAITAPITAIRTATTALAVAAGPTAQVISKVVGNVVKYASGAAAGHAAHQAEQNNNSH
jgi:hypothetical protein